MEESHMDLSILTWILARPTIVCRANRIPDEWYKDCPCGQYISSACTAGQVLDMQGFSLLIPCVRV